MRTWIWGLQYKQYTTIKIMHPSKIYLMHLILQYLARETWLFMVNSASVTSAVPPFVLLSRLRQALAERWVLGKLGVLWLPIYGFLQVEGVLDPKVLRDLQGAGQHHAEALRFCSSSPVVPFSSRCIREGLPWRQLVPLWKGGKKRPQPTVSCPYCHWGGLHTHCRPAQAQSCPFPLGKQILCCWRALSTFRGCNRKCWTRSPRSTLMGWGTVIRVPSPATWRPQDRNFIIIFTFS